MLQKIPLSFAQSWGACSKLFQLTNLRRLQISQDPKTSSSPHRFLQAYLKGKLISQTHPKPGLCSQQEALCGVIFSDLASGRQECVEGKYWTGASANEPCKSSTSINNQEIWLQSCHLPLVFETNWPFVSLVCLCLLACLCWECLVCFMQIKSLFLCFVWIFLKCAHYLLVLLFPFHFCFVLLWHESLNGLYHVFFLSFLLLQFLHLSYVCALVTCLQNSLATSSFPCVVVCPSFPFLCFVCLCTCMHLFYTSSSSWLCYSFNLACQKVRCTTSVPRLVPVP